jgi:hypothetical protein
MSTAPVLDQVTDPRPAPRVSGPAIPARPPLTHRRIEASLVNLFTAGALTFTAGVVSVGWMLVVR